jgi:histidinol phosphatase-like PHP family hydrolase
MDLPFHKVGIAHLTCSLIAPTREEYLEVLRFIPENEMKALFIRAAKLGVGIELNADDMRFSKCEADVILRIYKIAKDCGCKFYCGSDAHHPKSFESAKKIFDRAITLLELTEDDKFII